MNGFGGGFGNTAYFAPGGPGYQPYAAPVPPVQTYTGTDPTIYATDLPALVPSPNLPPVEAAYEAPPAYYNWEAPLDFTGLNFPDEPVSTPPIQSTPPFYEWQPPSEPVSTPPAIYDWQAPLNTAGFSFPAFTPPTATPNIAEFDLGGYTFAPLPVTPSIIDSAEPLWFNWEAPLDYTGLNFPDEPRTGPLESIGDFVFDVFGKVIDVGKFIIENMDIGVSYRGDFGGVKSQKAYYSTVGAPAPTILGIPTGAPSVRTSVSAGGGGGSPPMTEDERLYREAMQQTESDSSKMLLYGGALFLAYKIMIKKA